MITREEVVKTAREYLGTPHAHHGRVKGLKGAIDCPGLLICTLKDVGIISSSFDRFDYSKGDLSLHVADYLVDVADVIDSKEALPGDILVFRVTGVQEHVGFYTDIGVIHLLSKVVEHRLDDKWLDRIGGSFRLRGVT